MDRKKGSKMGNLIKDRITQIAFYDAEALENAEKSYGDSWQKRGGVGAFMMLARKWDRIENQVKKFNWNVFEAIFADPSPEGILDDIGDLRRYLFLVEDQIRNELSGSPYKLPVEAAQTKSNGSGSYPSGSVPEATSFSVEEAD